MKERNYIIVSGYGWSGSSALVDLLREFEGIYFANVEYRMIVDPYGIDNLKSNLIEKWSFLNSSAAIENFLKMAKKYSKPNNLIFSPYGLSYKKHFGNAFLKNSEKYAESLSSYCYVGNSFYHRAFNMSSFHCFFSRLSDGIYRKTKGRIKIPCKKNVLYFAKPTPEMFLEKTKEYINCTFDAFFREKNIVLLDQAVSPLNPDSLEYFENSKMIIVDRDPRDIYADLIKNKGLIGADLAKTHDVEKFVGWYLSGRHNLSYLKNNKNVLIVRFEDLVLKYESMVGKIKDFIGIDLGPHNKKGEFFNPDISKKNIGIYKNMGLTESEILLIEQKCDI